VGGPARRQISYRGLRVRCRRAGERGCLVVRGVARVVPPPVRRDPAGRTGSPGLRVDGTLCCTRLPCARFRFGLRGATHRTGVRLSFPGHVQIALIKLVVRASNAQIALMTSSNL
jgi:hypothetical protein